MKRFLASCWLLLFGIIVLGTAGCASPDSENAAERPWNAPKNWEHGLPPSMLEGR